jgi:hypothetical protein
MMYTATITATNNTWTASFAAPDALTSMNATRGQKRIAAARLDTSLRERLSVQNRCLRHSHVALRMARTATARNTSEARMSRTLNEPTTRGMPDMEMQSAATRIAVNDKARRAMVMIRL